MARCKQYSYSQGKFISVFFDKQILPGTFEYTLSNIVDNELDLSVFDDKYGNDQTGASAYDPRILLKIVLYAYSRGIVSSRKIEQACRENVIFMALSAGTRPHFTTIADFISSMDKEIIHQIRDVPLVCDDLGLIGKEMSAIDGCKMPSNASKEWSGTREDFEKKANKLEKAIAHIIAMPAASRAYGNPAGCLVPWPVRQGKGDLQRKDEAKDRLRRRPGPVQHAGSHCGAALCPHMPYHGSEPFYLAGQERGGHPVEAVLYRPQPEKGGPLRAAFYMGGRGKLKLFDNKTSSGKVMEPDGRVRQESGWKQNR